MYHNFLSITKGIGFPATAYRLNKIGKMDKIIYKEWTGAGACKYEYHIIFGLNLQSTNKAHDLINSRSEFSEATGSLQL